MPKQPSAVAKEGGFPVKLEVPAQGLKKTFRDAKQVHDFLTGEVQFWSELKTKAAGPAFNNSGQMLVGPAGETAARNALNASNAGMAAEEAVGVLNSLIREGGILSDGKQGRLVSSVMGDAPASGPYIAVALALAVRPETINGIQVQRINSHELAAAMAGQLAIRNPNTPERLQLDALLAEVSGLKSELERERAEIAEWREETAKLWGELQATIQKDLDDKFEKARLQTGGLIMSTEQQLEHLKLTTETSVRDYLAASSESTEAFKKRVRQDVVNEVPTTFWDDKATKHRNAAILAGAAFLAFAGIGVVLLATQGLPLISRALNEVTAINSGSAVLALVPIAFITIPALAFAWVLRHISRVLIQNLSLGADARLRGTITSTFRALVADRAMNDAELAIALQALFRPMDGRDHAEIAPPNLADLLKLDKQ